MTLQEYIDSLPKDEQFQLAIKLTRLSFPVWSNYADRNKLTYRDSVVGMTHIVDRNLLQRSVDIAEEYVSSGVIKKNIIGKNKLSEIYMEFREPVVGLQDTDWELPEEVLNVFYATYNIVRAVLGQKIVGSDEPCIYISISQAINALEESKTLTLDEIRIKIYGNAVSDKGKGKF